MKTRANEKTVTTRDKPVLVLIPATTTHYSGTANFFGKLDKIVVALSLDLPPVELLKEADKRKRYIATIQLWNAHTNRNARAARLAIEKLYGPETAKAWSVAPASDLFPGIPKRLRKRLIAISPETWKLRETKKSDLLDQAPRWNLPQEMSSHMKRARFVLWHNWREKRFVPALYCPDVTTALYVLAALRELRACPSCEKAFIPAREDQEYCSIPCRERFRQQRRREKLAKEEK